MSVCDRDNFGERKQGEHSKIFLDVCIRESGEELGFISLGLPSLQIGWAYLVKFEGCS